MRTKTFAVIKNGASFWIAWIIAENLDGTYNSIWMDRIKEHNPVKYWIPVWNIQILGLQNVIAIGLHLERVLIKAQVGKNSRFEYHLRTPVHLIQAEIKVQADLQKEDDKAEREIKQAAKAAKLKMKLQQVY